MIGIYKITNAINSKVYIGQSWDIDRRWYEHKHYPKQDNQHLQRAMNKYGLINFKFEVVLHIKDGPFTQRYLNTYESKFIEMFKSTESAFGYNKKSGGANGRPTAETRARLSAAQAGRQVSVETRARLSASLLGHSVSNATRAKISQGNIGKVISDEHRSQISRATKGRIRSEKSRALQSASTVGRKNPWNSDPERAAKISQSHRGIKLSEAHKQAIRDSKKRLSNEEHSNI
jgi:group I intron endonuclease